jgi:hypothetical protein
MYDNTVYSAYEVTVLTVLNRYEIFRIIKACQSLKFKHKEAFPLIHIIHKVITGIFSYNTKAGVLKGMYSEEI